MERSWNFHHPFAAAGKQAAAVLLSAAVLACGSGLAQSKVGTTAVPFLGITVGPRAAAMGGAFTAVADDATSLYYNPGGISRTAGNQAVFAHTDWIVNTGLNWIGCMLHLNGANSIGFSLTQLDYGEEDVTTVLQPEGTGEKWSAMDMAAAVSYARNLTDRFSIGGSVKYIQTRLWSETASAFALDVGLLFITDFNGMRLGMSISNFGTDMKMEGKDLLRRIDLDPEALGNNETIVANLKTDSWPLPLFFRVGLAMDVLKTDFSRLTVAADAFRPSDNTETVNVGGEYAFRGVFFLRGGYQSLFRDDSDGGPTFGAGIHAKLGGRMECVFDYAYSPMNLLPDIQMMSMGIGF
jgi:hypothetical protein